MAGRIPTKVSGAVIVVSHDRRFLTNVIGTVWELEHRTITSYTGGFLKYREIKAANRVRQIEEYGRQQAEIARQEEYIRRNKAGQNSRNAMGRAKQLARLERVERPVDEKVTMAAQVDTSGRSGREVVVCERATKRYGNKAILDNANFTIERGMRVGVVGPNGVGKSTLIEMVVGEEVPDSGYLRVGHGVTVAYHKQEADDFDGEESVLDTFYDRAGMTVGEARSHLAKFLFTGEDVFKPISALSGGERSKLALALMVLSPANLLILDEPTNHLDVYSCDALTEALQSYKGTLLVVSHDRSLLDAATDTTLALTGNGKTELFEGAYSAWRAEQEETVKTPPPVKSKSTQPVSTPVPQSTSHGQSKERQKAVKRVATIEAEIAKIESQIAEIETALSAPKGVDHAIQLSKEYEAAKEVLNMRFMEWEEATMEAESLGASV
jgi:ATP-binding cassette subfamily F protein 3